MWWRQWMPTTRKQSPKAQTSRAGGTGLCPECARPFDRQPKLLKRLFRNPGLEHSLACQLRKCSRDVRLGIDLEVPAQVFTIIRAPKAIRAQGNQPRSQPRGE